MVLSQKSIYWLEFECFDWYAKHKEYDELQASSRANYQSVHILYQGEQLQVYRLAPLVYIAISPR